MAEQDRRKSSGKSKPPITSHPLFPAIVALWFGALFGLGSLAIRPGLLETVVLAAQIDTLVPAAAPPLGLTSRILLALVMSGLGGLIGATIAHRIAAPRPERRERRRGAGVVAGTAHGVGEGRRRPLTGDLAYAPRDFDEHAPLPGGSPQILHVSDFDFAEPAPADRRPAPSAQDDPAEETLAPRRAPAPEAVEVRLVGGRSGEEAAAAAVVAPLDLATFAEEDALPAQMPEAHVSLSRESAPAPAPARRFDAPQSDALYGIFARDDEPGAQAALPERFDAITRSAPPLFGNRAPVAEDEAPLAPAATAPIAPAAPVAPAAVAAPVSIAVPQPAPAPFAAPAATVRLAMGAAPQAASPAATAPATPVQADSPPAAAIPAPASAETGFAPPSGSAAERIASAQLAELSPVELIERLALSLQARRERAPAAPVQAAEPVVPFAAPAPVEPLPFAAPAATSGEAPAPASAFARPVPVAIALEGTGIVPPPVSLPAALRPVGLELDDEDGDNLPSYVPPRHIAFAPPQATTPAPFAEPVVPPAADESPVEALVPAQPAFARLPRGDEPVEEALDDVAEDAAEATVPGDEESQALEDGYSSLLDLTRRPAARQAFVRIDEPEPEAAAIEPVVIFPGQAASPAPAPRPFDAPTGVPAAARLASAPLQSPDETERALRTALASLQRMSGAA